MSLSAIKTFASPGATIRVAREHHNTAKQCPCCWHGNYVVFQGIWISIAKNSCIFGIFHVGEGVWTSCLPPLDLGMVGALRKLIKFLVFMDGSHTFFFHSVANAGYVSGFIIMIKP